MKNLLLPGSICLILISCSPKPGSLTGNVYWKYNDFVGNKPDAGAQVFLFSRDTAKSPVQVDCDLQGNFNIDGLAPGEYIVAVKSKATYASTEDQIDNLISFLQDPMMGLPSIRLNQIDRFMDCYYDAKRLEIDRPLSRPSGDDSLNYYRSTARKIADSILNELPAEMPFKKWVLFYGGHVPANVSDFGNAIIQPKINMQRVKIESDKVQKIVIDFGITYM
jgi:hypothetical protein